MAYLLSTLAGGTKVVPSSLGSSTTAGLTFLSFLGLGLDLPPFSSPGMSGRVTGRGLAAGAGAAADGSAANSSAEGKKGWAIGSFGWMLGKDLCSQGERRDWRVGGWLYSCSDRDHHRRGCCGSLEVRRGSAGKVT